MQKTSWIACLVLAAAACGGGPPNEPQPDSPDRPHIVYILADDMGYGDVAVYNPESLTPTPNIDSLARQGIRFTDAHSPSAVCSPTRYGILTGRYAWRTWLKRGAVGGYTPPLIEPGRPTVASFLRDNGYTTAMIGKWHIGVGWVRANGFVGTAENAADHWRGSWQDGDPGEGMNVDFTQPIQGGPTELGFDYAYFTAACSTIDGPFCYIENEQPTELPDRSVFVDPDVDADRRPRRGWIAPGFSLETVDLDFTERAVGFMEESLSGSPDRPFFVYLALSSPHTLWLPPTFAQGVSGDGDRGDMVVVADWAVGQIVEALDRLGVADDTLLIVASDNGPRIGTNGHKSAGDLRGYKSHIWEGGHRIPFIARWPGHISAGALSGEPVELTDLMGTVAGIIGVELPDDAGPDSYDISSALFGRDRDGPIREAIVSLSENGSYAIRHGPWKLIEGTDGSGGWVEPSDDPYDPERPGQLYNLQEDRGERTNVIEEHPEIVEQLGKLLQRYRETGRSRLE